MRGMFSGLMALVFAWVVFSRYDDEIGTEVSENERQKYLPYIPGTLLPGFLIAITILATYFYGFSGAAKPDLAIPLYEAFMAHCRERGFAVEHGEFGADMQVDSRNDGPVTMMVEYP